MTNVKAIRLKEIGAPVVAFGVKYRCICDLSKEYISNKYQRGYALRAYLEDFNGNSVTKVKVKDLHRFIK